MSQPSMFKPGDTLLNGKYTVEAFVGKGAFAEVYRVRHVPLNVTRAIKVLHRDMLGVGSTDYDFFRKRFELEAQLLAHLHQSHTHPHIIQVFDIGQDNDNGVLTQEMEYASGGSVAGLIRRTSSKSRSVSLEDAVWLARDAAEGLAALHRIDIVHRDIKPSNVLIDAHGQAKIADLGLAQTPESRFERGSAAASHPGTPEYMPPEQQTGSKTALRASADVYALGCVLFEVLTGRMYFHQKAGTQIGAFRAEVPGWLEELVAHMLAEDAKMRPWDGGEVARLLQEGWAKQSPTDDAIRKQKEEAEHQKQRAEAAKSRSSTEFIKFATRVPSLQSVSPRRTITPVLLWTLSQDYRGYVGERFLNTLNSVDISPDNTLLAVGSYVFDSTGQIAQLITSGRIELRDLLTGHTRPPFDGFSSEAVYNVAFGTQGKTLIASGVSGSPPDQQFSLRWWDMSTRVQKGSLLPSSRRGLTFSLSPDRSHLATLVTYPVDVLRLADRRLLARINPIGYLDEQFVRGTCVFSPDNTLLAASWNGSDTAIHIYILPRSPGLLFTTQLRPSLTLPGRGLQMAFSPDGRFLVSAGDRAMRIWQMPAGHEVKMIPVSQSWVGLAFSPTNSYLVMTADRKIQIRDWPSLQVLTELEHDDSVRGMALSSNGAFLATISSEATLKVWRI